MTPVQMLRIRPSALPYAPLCVEVKCVGNRHLQLQHMCADHQTRCQGVIFQGVLATPLPLQALNYELAEGVGIDDLAEEDRFYLGDGYKRTVLEHMSTSQLLDMLLIHPTVSVSPSYRDTGLTASYTFKPLSNLVGAPCNPLQLPCKLLHLHGHWRHDQRAVTLPSASGKLLPLDGTVCPLQPAARSGGTVPAIRASGSRRPTGEWSVAELLNCRAGVHTRPADHNGKGHRHGAAALVGARAGGRAHEVLLRQTGCALSHCVLGNATSGNSAGCFRQPNRAQTVSHIVMRDSRHSVV